jgi:hypothetical protein
MNEWINTDPVRVVHAWTSTIAFCVVATMPVYYAKVAKVRERVFFWFAIQRRQ